MLFIKTLLVVLLFTIPTSGMGLVSTLLGFIFVAILLIAITFREIWGWEEGPDDEVRLYRSHLFGWTAIRGRPYLALFSQKYNRLVPNTLIIKVDSVQLEFLFSRQEKPEHLLSWTHRVYSVFSRFVQWMFPYGNFALHITLLIIAGGFLEGQIYWLTALICSVLYWGISYYLHEFSRDLKDELVQNITNMILGFVLIGMVLYLLGEWALVILGSFALLMVIATNIAKASKALPEMDTDNIVLCIKHGKLSMEIADLIGDLLQSEEYASYLAQDYLIDLAKYHNRSLETESVVRVLQGSPLFHQIGDKYGINVRIV